MKMELKKSLFDIYFHQNGFKSRGQHKFYKQTNKQTIKQANKQINKQKGISLWSEGFLNLSVILPFSSPN